MHQNNSMPKWFPVAILVILTSALLGGGLFIWGTSTGSSAIIMLGGCVAAPAVIAIALMAFVSWITGRIGH